jgi:hypothetical protein
MVKYKILILSALLFSSPVVACDFSTGIEKSGSGYLYSVDCHKHVGKIVLDLEDRESQVQSLNKALELKTQALTIADERNLKLRESLYKVEDRVDSMERLKRTNEVLYFVGGVLLTGLAVWGAGHLK